MSFADSRPESGGFRFPTPTGAPPFATILLGIGLIVALACTGPFVDFRPLDFWSAVRNIFETLRGFIVMPDWAFFPTLFARLGETFEIAFVAAGIALSLSLPIGLLAARNASPHPVVFQLTRGLLVVVRALPDIVIALALVAALGLGPLPGVLALAITTVGYMARFFADAIEVSDKKAAEAVTATGGSSMHVRLYALLPQALPDLSSTTFYAFDSGVRAATILGVVGAGGIGYDLKVSLGLFQYERVVPIILAIFVAVSVVDWASAFIRRKIV